MASVASSGGSGLFKFLKPRLRPQSDDIQAAAMWGVAAGATALYLIQPFNWLKKTFFEKPEPEVSVASTILGPFSALTSGSYNEYFVFEGTLRFFSLPLVPLFFAIAYCSYHRLP